jgi:hypothetical protein
VLLREFQVLDYGAERTDLPTRGALAMCVTLFLDAVLRLEAFEETESTDSSDEDSFGDTPRFFGGIRPYTARDYCERRD